VILVCYDGSPDAQEAIDRAGELFGGEAVTVVTVWVPFVELMTRSGAGLRLASGMVDFDEIDGASEAVVQIPVLVVPAAEPPAAGADPH
jgi:hypothetical protein